MKIVSVLLHSIVGYRPTLCLKVHCSYLYRLPTVYRGKWWVHHRQRYYHRRI